jgi:hypothetical protein
MKRIVLAGAIALIASGTAFAQPSQGQAGAQAGVNGEAPNSPDSLMQSEVPPGVTTGTGNGIIIEPYPERAPVMNPSALGPSSEGNVGPGTMNNNGPTTGQH